MKARELSLLVGERQSGESDKAVIACNDYLRLGAGRTFGALVQNYNAVKKSLAPTQSLGTLAVWSSGFQWARRAAEYDAQYEIQKTADYERVMSEGLARASERVLKLMELAALLESQIYEQGEGGELHNLWVPDVKQIGRGDFAERVDIERFNPSLISEYRAVLDDIAKEVGGRIKNMDIKSDGKQLTAPAIYLPAVVEDTNESSGS